MALVSGPQHEEIVDILMREGRECILFPLLLSDTDPEFTENLPDLPAVRPAEGRPVHGRAPPYLLDGLFDRMCLSELEPPPAQLLIAGAGHSCGDSELSCSG